MTRKFKERVINESIVDTRKYRYVLTGCTIYRLPIAYLDTTAALDSWEKVATIH